MKTKSYLLVFALLSLLVPALAFSQEEGDEIYYPEEEEEVIIPTDGSSSSTATPILLDESDAEVVPEVEDYDY